MQSYPNLEEMPPEIITMIYNATDIKTKVNLSMVNSYIYDCRSANEIDYHRRKFIHSKLMISSIERIKSIEYNIIDQTNTSGETKYLSSRFLNNRETVYSCYDCGSISVHSYGRNKFIPSARMMIKKYKVQVDIHFMETHQWIHTLLYETRAKYLYCE